MMKRSYNIYEIKKATAKTAPYFFSKATMKFFGQKMSDFKIKKQPDGRIKITAKSRTGEFMEGITIRYFNPENNELEMS